MILFVFEGVKREPDLFRTIQRLYFSNREEQIVCSYNNNIYQLYKDLQEYDGDGDIVSLLMEKFASQKDNPLKDIDRSADISEIYLFFDYDFHNRNLSLEEINRQVKEMLETFDNETEYGKLYIDYPMVESIRYTKFLPDANYWTYTISRTDCSRFKGLSAEFSAYRSFDFILLTENREPTEDYRRGNRGSQAELGIFERTEREQSKLSLQWRERNTSIKRRHSSGQDIRFAIRKICEYRGLQSGSAQCFPAIHI